MANTYSRLHPSRTGLVSGVALLSLSAGSICLVAQTTQPHFTPGNLVVSRSVYDNNAANVTVGEQLPPNCAATQGGCAGTTGATNNGLYPYVFNNAFYDGSFGITSKIFLDQITPFGAPVNTLEVPNSKQASSADQLVTSFSSKSEIGLHLSLSGKYLTFMGYISPIDALDVSNSNTPGAIDPTNPVGENVYRAVATVGANGKFHFTETNAYSGNNGRSAILNDLGGNDIFYTAGNAGNGANPQPDGIILGAGAQIIDEVRAPEDSQGPGQPTPVASFNVTELGDKADKIGKDDNFRGLTVYHNVVYYTKGSGGNGVDTVYYVDTVGGTCPNGSGLPAPGAKLPTAALMANLDTLQTTGLPSNMCVLAGFPTLIAKKSTNSFPFGLWFANATTLYVADDGDGYASAADLYTHAAAQTTAGLQKWVFDATMQQWKLAYTLQKGLNLGSPYTVAGYPTGNNAANGNLPWAPAADGLRNLIGYTYDDVAVVYAITSTVSGSGDQGADPNKLVAVFDVVSNRDPNFAGYEFFLPVKDAGFAEVLRGVALTPGTPVTGSR